LRLSPPASTEAINQGGEVISTEPRINDRIRVPQVRLIGFSGEQVGVVDIDTALKMADEVGLDLVEIAPEAQPPVCKVMDFGKYKYEIAQKAREARQNQTHIERFLKGGDKVKVTIQFRGREQARPEIGYRLLMKLAEELSEVAFVEFAPKQEGRNMTMVLGTNVKKGQSVSQQKAAKAASRKKEAVEEVTEA